MIIAGEGQVVCVKCGFPVPAEWEPCAARCTPPGAINRRLLEAEAEKNKGAIGSLPDSNSR